MKGLHTIQNTASKRRQVGRRDRGASVVFALFGLMIAAMVSMVVVGAAWMNAQRVGNLRDEEQAYLTVTSVADVVYEAIADKRTTEARMANTGTAGLTIARSEIEVETVDGGTSTLLTFYANADGSGYVEQVSRVKACSFFEGGKSPATNVPTSADTVKTAVQRTVWALAREVDAGSGAGSEVLQLAVKGKSRMAATLTVAMDKDYNLTMTIASECGDGAKKAKYEMVMQCYASQIKSASIENVTLTIGEQEVTAPRKITTYSYDWPAEMISAQKKTA